MTKPYYCDELVTLYHGDCREITAWRTADVLVTDPPYGMGYVSGWRAAPITGDANAAIRDVALVLWGDRPALVFGTWRVARPPATRTVLVWDKGEWPGMGDLALPWGPSHEEIYVLGEGFVGAREGTVLRVRRLGATSSATPEHPTPKPVSLMERLLEKCPPGQVADPFAGAGATLVAAKGLGRRAVGVEVEERYCEIAARRLAQGALDFGVAP